MISTNKNIGNFNRSLAISAAGMHAQAMRTRIISENLSNAGSTAPSPDKEPYRRKMVFFENVYNKTLGAHVVKVSKVGVDHTPLQVIHRPHDPGADANGNVKKSNVHPVMEMMDLREAGKSHEANLTAYKATLSMLDRTIDAMR